VACPNKGFPVDVQHVPPTRSVQSHHSKLLCRKTGLNVSQDMGHDHLLSYAEPGDLSVWQQLQRPPLKVFGFGKFQQIAEAFGLFREVVCRLFTRSASQFRAESVSARGGPEIEASAEQPRARWQNSRYDRIPKEMKRLELRKPIKDPVSLRGVNPGWSSSGVGTHPEYAQ